MTGLDPETFRQYRGLLGALDFVVGLAQQHAVVGCQGTRLVHLERIHVFVMQFKPLTTCAANTPHESRILG
jgi:hypothetical protein